jgi:hypothetical protein
MKKHRLLHKEPSCFSLTFYYTDALSQRHSIWIYTLERIKTIIIIQSLNSNKMKKFDTIKKLLGVMVIMLVSSAGFAQFQNRQVDINVQLGNVQLGLHNNSAAKFGGNSLVVDTRGGSDFMVVVDNGYTYRSNGNAVVVNNLYNGDHRVTIYQRQRAFWGGSRQKIIYDSKICLKPGTETSLFITGFGQVVMNEKPIYRQYDRGYGHNRGDNNGYDRRDDNGYDRRNDNDNDRWNK